MLQTPIKQDPSLQDVHSLAKETITKRNKYNKRSLACKNKEPLKSDKLHLVSYLLQHNKPPQNSVTLNA